MYILLSDLDSESASLSEIKVWASANFVLHKSASEEKKISMKVLTYDLKTLTFNLLSSVANLMANISDLGISSAKSADAVQIHHFFRLWVGRWSFMDGVTVIKSYWFLDWDISINFSTERKSYEYNGLWKMEKLTEMIGTNFQSFISSHDYSNGMIRRVMQQFCFSSTSFFPYRWRLSGIESIKLGTSKISKYFISNESTVTKSRHNILQFQQNVLIFFKSNSFN